VDKWRKNVFRVNQLRPAAFTPCTDRLAFTAPRDLHNRPPDVPTRIRSAADFHFGTQFAGRETSLRPGVGSAQAVGDLRTMPSTENTLDDDEDEDEALSLEDFIVERPLLSVGIAALIGFVLAKTIL
jgi:hypothetical protein